MSSEEKLKPDFRGLWSAAHRHGDRRRPDVVAEALKSWIVEQGMKPGDRLPQERDLIDAFGVSKSTIREALRALQTQGLITTRTGPGGGAFIGTVSERRAIELLGNYFFFKSVTIGDIYQLRKMLEPEMAASVVGRINEAGLARLKDMTTAYAEPPRTIDEEREQRIAELEFHSNLVEFCPNPILAFQCRFLIRLLQDLTICRRIYDRPNPELRERGRSYQLNLIEAVRSNNAQVARQTMHEHMCAAQELMEAQEAIVVQQFLSPDYDDKP